jgi:hypothetical protein
MRRSFGNERDYAHEKPSAVLHLKITPEFQGWDNDRDRPWDIWSHYCTLNEDCEVVDRGRFRTNPSGVDKRFWNLERVQVAMETGTHSIWVSEQIRELGHEVIVANVRELRAISHSFGQDRILCDARDRCVGVGERHPDSMFRPQDNHRASFDHLAWSQLKIVLS